MTKHFEDSEILALVTGNHGNPGRVLGGHQKEEGYVIYCFQPYAEVVTVIDLVSRKRYPMKKIKEEGLFSVTVTKPLIYRFDYQGYDGHRWQMYDAYSFQGQITDLDAYLFSQAVHYEIYEKLGAHKMTLGGVKGVHFAVWAPNAVRVSVIGDFCGWDGRIFPMNRQSESSIFELFIPNLKENERYKYEIKNQQGHLIKKADPYAYYAELRPRTASIVYDIDGYQWMDENWQKAKLTKNIYQQPMSIYELHLGSWKKNESDTGFLNYKELAHQVVDYVKHLGYTHIELMPITEHPFDGSWGYQVTGYYAPTSRFGEPDDFMYFIDYCHQNDIGVIADWVPAHFPKDEHGLVQFDGTALYEHADYRQGEHPHWGTLIYNYGRNEVKNFLIANALFWIEKYHLDGLRVDAVASMLYLDYGKESGEWVPNPQGGRENLEAVEFFKHLNSVIYKRNPSVLMIAEESTSWQGVSRPTDVGGLGFGFKWNMGWMNDFLHYMSREAIHRQYHHHDLIFSMVYTYTENFILVLSHDEVVHGKGSMINKMPGDYWQKFANLRCAYAFMFTHPGKKLMFMGDEIAQFEEWSERKSIDWHLLEFEKHQQMQNYVASLNSFYKKEKALWQKDYDQAGFEWINCHDAQASLVSFLRKTDNPDETLLIISNFTPTPKTWHRVGVPYAGGYVEVFNSDDLAYGGSGVTNPAMISSDQVPYDQFADSIQLQVPPLGTVVLKQDKTPKSLWI